MWGVRRRGATPGRGEGIQRRPLRGGHRGTPVPPASLPPAARRRKGCPRLRRLRRGGGVGLRCRAGDPGLGRCKKLRAGLAWSGRDRGTGGAASSHTRLSVSGKAAAKHVGGSRTASVPARSRERDGQRGRASPCARLRSAASLAAPPRWSCPRSPGAFSAAAEREGRNSCDVLTKLK